MFKIAYLTVFVVSSITQTMFGQLITINAGIRSNDDGSSKLTKKDSIHIKTFSVENFDKVYTYKSKEFIDFELFNAKDCKLLFSKSKYTWVFIQSSWCGVCVPSLKKYIQLADSLKDEGIRIIVVNQDIQIPQLQKKIFKQGFRYQTYIIDPNVYGTMETKKQELFVSELADGKAIEGYSSSGVPKNLFFNSKGELVYYSPINDITTQTLKEKVLKSE
ncbi:MAG: redoxin domain-containing protein [Nitrosopumilus sp.]|nr:redoxin domain-containing protein [Nitrosopumilus sp.]